MLKFSEWHQNILYITSVNDPYVRNMQKELYYIYLIDPVERHFRISIHQTQNLFDVGFSFDHKSEIYVEIYRKFIDSQTNKNTDLVFSDIEAAKEHVESFLNFLNKCINLSAFL